MFPVFVSEVIKVLFGNPTAPYTVHNSIPATKIDVLRSIFFILSPIGLNMYTIYKYVVPLFLVLAENIPQHPLS